MECNLCSEIADTNCDYCNLEICENCESECFHCGNRRCHDCMVQCECDHYLCKDECAHICEDCESEQCDECMSNCYKQCKQCNHKRCEVYLNTCKTCQKYFCSDFCMKDNICNICKENI